MDKRFTDIIQLIKQSQTNAIKAVNSELINLYWNMGEHISKKLEKSEWGDSVVSGLAKYIQQNEPTIKGFSDKNIWRMKQFYETYKDFPKLSTVLREISWSHNLAIFSRCSLKTNIKTEDWNTFHLVVKGNRLLHYVNGVLMSDVTDNDLINGQSKGFLGMQVHVGPPIQVKYRNLRLKE